MKTIAASNVKLHHLADCSPPLFLQHIPVCLKEPESLRKACPYPNLGMRGKGSRDMVKIECRMKGYEYQAGSRRSAWHGGVANEL